MAVGDAVVWWRATALYPHNKAVKLIGAILISSTFGEYANGAFLFVG